MENKLRVGIVGVSGYGGGELARLLLAHPHVELTYVTSGTYAGKPLRAALPGAVPSDLVCEVFDPAACADKCDFVFLAGESGLAMKIAPGLLEAGKKIVDLSADFRLKDPAVYKEWYKAEHTAPQLLEKAVYGLPELNAGEIAEARLVANPGCHVTAAVLSLLPLLNGFPRLIMIQLISSLSLWTASVAFPVRGAPSSAWIITSQKSMKVCGPTASAASTDIRRRSSKR